MLSVYIAQKRLSLYKQTHLKRRVRLKSLLAKVAYSYSPCCFMASFSPFLFCVFSPYFTKSNRLEDTEKNPTGTWRLFEFRFSNILDLLPYTFSSFLNHFQCPISPGFPSYIKRVCRGSHSYYTEMVYTIYKYTLWIEEESRHRICSIISMSRRFALLIFES